MVQELPSHVPPPEPGPRPPAPLLPEPPLGLPMPESLLLAAPLLDDIPEPSLPEEATWSTLLRAAEASELVAISTLPPQLAQPSAGQKTATNWSTRVQRLAVARIAYAA
jgi:hypothetical protein